MTTSPRLISCERCCGGEQRLYSHRSEEIGLRMRFAVYLPPQASRGPVPALVFLAGLACNEESFMSQAGAQRYAAERGIALIAPDTSPRHARIPGEGDDWEVGLSAGYWLDATQAPWAAHYRMESYLMRELLPAVGEHLPVDARRIGICGHSVGGHAALRLALKYPERFRSVSAFAPVCSLPHSAWGKKALTAFLGAESALWDEHDAARLLALRQRPFPQGLLVDQGLADKHLAAQLQPEALEAACRAAQQALTLRRHEAYEHSYYFIASFIADHLAHHAAILDGD